MNQQSYNKETGYLLQGRSNKEVALMSRKLIQLFLVALFAAGLLALTQTTRAQTTYPNPAPLNRPDFNYAEANSCTRCHFMRGEGGDHMLEAVGVKFDDAKQTFSFTSNGWFTSKHAATNYASTQNTYCAKCHSPLQAKPESEFKVGMSEPIAYGKVEGVTCAACHPSHTSAVVLGRRLGIYKFGMDKSKPEAYDVIHHGEEDLLCLNCHTTRHNEDNQAMQLMYVAGVRCIDCHMAPYGNIKDSHVEKRFHDFKVASNLPYSCGVQGSVVHCHPEFGVESTMKFIPYLKEQHKPMWTPENMPRKLRNVVDYRKLWNSLEKQFGGQ